MTCDVPIVVAPVVPVFPPIMNNPPRREPDRPTRGGEITLYSSRNGVREAVLTIDTGSKKMKTLAMLRDAGYNPDAIAFSVTLDGSASEFEELRDALGLCPSGSPLLKELHTFITKELIAGIERFQRKKPPKLVGAFHGRGFYVDPNMPQEEINELMRMLARANS